MSLLSMLFPSQRSAPSRGVSRQPIATVHGSNRTAGSTLTRQDVSGRLGVSTRFGGRNGNARGKR